MHHVASQLFASINFMINENESIGKSHNIQQQFINLPSVCNIIPADQSLNCSTKATGSAALMAALLPPVGEINRVSPQSWAGPIDCSNLLMEMRGRRCTYWAIWRCYFDLGADPCLHRQCSTTQIWQSEEIQPNKNTTPEMTFVSLM